MAYRDDPDLAFLSKCTDEELDDLVYLLIYDKDGNARLTEELTMTDVYKKYKPRHSLYWKEIAGEIQCFGANSLATIFVAVKVFCIRKSYAMFVKNSKYPIMPMIVLKP